MAQYFDDVPVLTVASFLQLNFPSLNFPYSEKIPFS